MAYDLRGRRALLVTGQDYRRVTRVRSRAADRRGSGGGVRVDVGGLSFDVAAGGPDGRARRCCCCTASRRTPGCGTASSPLLHDAGLRTLALDQRGYSPGARPAGVAAYAIGELVGDALGVLDVLGLSAVHVVGHDWGAVVGWHLAARHPDRVRTLTAVSVPHPAAHAAALRSDPEQRELSAYIRPVPGAGGKAEAALLADDARRLRADVRAAADRRRPRSSSGRCGSRAR